MNHLSDTQLQLLIEEPKENSLYHDHIAECSQCRQAFDSMREVHNRLSMMEYEKPSMRFAKNIFEIIVRKQQLEHQELKWVRVIQVSLLSSIFLVLILGCYYIFTMNWDLHTGKESINECYQWSITILLSICIVWIVYGLDNWLTAKKHSQ